ncbi:hypothetical protein ACO2Q3_15020 [Caulobacter sp. KR2-114]|uniref:hypothetical protein n=1 Tax=Caulobacter sp. KR2-114 TaxID=3400912 RepID=UPI003C05631F
MCDTLVGLAPATATGGAIFGKNSDRERNEAQGLEFSPRARHAAGAPLQLTYVAIPQVAQTHACLLSRPFWMWGAEMGANEHGVVIGNEAVFAKVPAARRRSLIGMDLVRLGLERGATAAEALEVMIALLERHGQGGDCGHLARFYYHNSFIVADAGHAFVLETVGRWWAVEQVAGGLRALSNALSIGPRADRVSGALAAHAAAEGWTDGDGRFDFAGRLLDEERDAISRGRLRCARGQALLQRRRGTLDALGMMAILRDHGEAAENDPDWHPAHTVGRTLCMHAAEGPRRSQSVGSLVSDIRRTRPALHWVTGTSAPCLSLFKPFVFGAALPAHGPPPSDRYDGETLWWRHEQLHRAAYADFAACLAELAPERDRLEAAFAARMDEALAKGGRAVQTAVDVCWAEAEAAETRWRAAAQHATGKAPAPFARSWARLNQVAGFDKG